jgi:hypothetical protein
MRNESAHKILDFLVNEPIPPGRLNFKKKVVAEAIMSRSDTPYNYWQCRWCKIIVHKQYIALGVNKNLLYVFERWNPRLPKGAYFLTRMMIISFEMFSEIKTKVI